MKFFFLLCLTFATLSASDLTNEQLQELYLWPKYSVETRRNVSKFLEGDTFNLWDYGNIHDKVPKKYAKKMQSKYGFFCSSGTSALHASLMALGLKRGDRVAVPAMTFIRAITPLVHMGLVPVLVDIDPVTGNLDPRALINLHDPAIKAVIVVHMWGVPADMTQISAVASMKNWKLIEDFSHAHFSQDSAGYVGTIGDIGYASLQRKKNISVGEGGLITTQNQEIFERVRIIVSPGSYNPSKNHVDHAGFGLNMRMAPTSIIIADSLHPHIDTIIETRSGSAQRLIQMMSRYPEIFDVPVIPDHVIKVSWYALRPKINVPLEKLIEAAKGTRWRFGKMNYPMIADHCFWKKDPAFFPFSDHITIVNLNDSFPGAKTYLEGRIGCKIPSLSPEDWTDDEFRQWEEDLVKIVDQLK